MCNIAGYTGNKNAAPILIEMMRRQQGFSGGYFTGIALVNDGEIAYAKRQGDLDRLISTTDASALEGKCGIIHGRSNGQGGDLFAHPFLGGKGEKPKTAYVANGIGTRDVKRKEASMILAQSLFDEGYNLGLEKSGCGYITLSNGACVHISDVMCQLITRYIYSGVPTQEAMLRGYYDLASEIVGLLIDRSESDKIYFARYNFPMFSAFDDDGCYLSSTPIAFPDTILKIVPIPPMSYGYVTSSSITIFPMRSSPVSVAECDEKEKAELFGQFVDFIKQGKVDFDTLAAFVRRNMPQNDCDCKDHYQLSHAMLFSLYKKGLVAFSEERRPTVLPDCTAPQIMIEWKR